MATRYVSLYRGYAGRMDLYRGVPEHALQALQHGFAIMIDLTELSGFRIWPAGQTNVADEVFCDYVSDWSALREEVTAFFEMGMNGDVDQYKRDLALDRLVGEQKRPPSPPTLRGAPAAVEAAISALYGGGGGGAASGGGGGGDHAASGGGSGGRAARGGGSGNQPAPPAAADVAAAAEAEGRARNVSHYIDIEPTGPACPDCGGRPRNLGIFCFGCGTVNCARCWLEAFKRWSARKKRADPTAPPAPSMPCKGEHCSENLVPM